MPGLAHIQYGDHYPLVDPSDDIKYLISDITVSYDSMNIERALPLSISLFNRVTGELELINANRRRVFHGTADSIRDWGGDKYKIYAWNVGTTSVKMAINSEIDTPSVITPKSAVIDLRAVFLIPPRVTSINGYTGNIRLEAGYNMEMSDEAMEEDLRTGAIINMNAVSGAGKGKLSYDKTTPITSSLKYIAGASPDKEGNVFLVGEAGPQVSATCNAIYVGNSNVPCCQCSDMENLATYMNDVSNEYKVLGGLTKWIHNEYVKNLNKWNNRCTDESEESTESPKPTGKRKPPVAIKIWLVPGSCPYVRLKVQITNLNDKAWCDLEMEGTFTPSMCRISEIYTNTESSEGKMAVWINDVIKEVDGTYMESTYTANRYYVKLRDDRAPKKCEFGKMRWKGTINPNESIYYQADFKLDKPQPPRKEIEIEFHIDYIHVKYVDNTTISLWHHSPYAPYDKPCLFGEADHGVLHQPGILNGRHKATAIIDCDERIDDTVENIGRVEDIRDEIYDIKNRYWPCPKKEEEDEGIIEQ